MKGIICPHCNHEHTDWQEYVDTGDMKGAFPMDCEDCEKEFRVDFSTVITFKSTTDI